MTKLAVLESGEPAVRILAAVGNHNRRSGAGEPITTLVVHRGGSRHPWFAREADGSLAVEALDPDEVAAALVAAGVDMVWPGLWDGADHTATVAACERAGLAVVGPDSATRARLADNEQLGALLADLGISMRPEGSDPADLRIVEADVMADGAGTAWTLGLREVSVSGPPGLLFSESPVAQLTDQTATAIRDAAVGLVRAAGVTGAAVVRFWVSAGGDECWFAAIDTLARPEHALMEESTGAGIVGLRLRVALGEHLDPDPPAPDGWTVAARLLAVDPPGGATGVGRLRLFDLPVGTGVRVDGSRRVGDVIEDRDRLLATVTAWGRDRDEALRRLRRALERTTVVLESGVSNRSELLSLLAREDLAAGPVPVGWYGALVAEAALVPPADPIALLAAAVEAYDADLAAVRGTFLASAKRGRPQNPESVGTALSLDYRGQTYRVRIDRTSAENYRIHSAGVAVSVTVERLGRFERRLTCQGHKRRVVTVAQDAAFRVEVDGVAHLVTRVDGMPVRACWPALVSELLVEPGQHVAEGQALAVLESMKMVSTISAPYAGEVLSVDAAANSQVERGAPILRLRATGLRPGSGGPQAAVDLSACAATEGPADTPAAVYRELTDYLLGYDLDPAGLKSLAARQAALGPEDDQALVAEEDAFLDLYAELGGLYRPRTEGETSYADAESQANTQEFFLAFLQWLDADRAGLPSRYRARLEHALERYGVASLEQNEQLEAAMLWMFRSFSRVPAMAPYVLTILDRRLAHSAPPAPSEAAEVRFRLTNLARATHGRQQTIADQARDLLFAFFDETVLTAATARIAGEMSGHLEALRADPTRADAADRINQLVLCPQPLRGTLLRAWHDGEGQDPRFRDTILEIYARRFYRIRNLHGLDHGTFDGTQLGFANYEFEGRPIHLVVGYGPLEQLRETLAAVGHHAQGVPAERELVVDLVTWRAGTRPEIEDMSAQVAELLDGVDVGRPIHRLDLTITSTEGEEPERDRTQHLTFRQDQSGAFAEELLYRNLHPMLGKRLDLWRLSNFTLERLASPEDIYLFHGVAHDNPRDHRLFALAEVRDLVRVENEETGAVSYPGLGRVGLQALAAMRAALAHYPPRERPTANRLVLSVRPTWDIAPDEWSDLASSYEPLARGAGLERLVLHVKLPVTGDDGRPALADKVLYLDGIGKGLLSIRMGDPGPNPVRPLTPYAQKVLTSERFGVPYPYEIIRMLTPSGADASEFPRGGFVELDLDADGETLVPVTREPGRNSAHLVVGLITNHTEVVPEGMTRVAILSDPTQGLGNLAEPECRRINAALAYALEHRIPVEWYAVSSGALIAMDSGTENMDWIALTLRRLIEYTQAGGEINIIVTGINVGGQPYWNAEATMLMHTKGILIMTPNSAMVLTGKQALDFSGAVSADDNFGIGGYDRIMGANGQGQYWAPSFAEACKLLLLHYDYAYVVPGERFPRRRPTTDPAERDVRESPHQQVPGSTFTTVGDVFSLRTNPDRKQPFDMRSVMRSVADADCEPIERWKHWVDSDTSIVWDATVGGIPVCMLGLESRTVPRKGFVPSYGPPAWTSGTLFPQASRKTARAVNACSGNRPLLVLANLSGFDGSPESMRNWQLEYGAEIGRAITNFDGPIVFVVVSRYHGGAFVVFSKALTESMEIAAVEGSYASVIGGAPAAATVFAREIKIRTEKDPRVVAAREAASAARGKEAGPLRAELAAVSSAVRSEKLGEVADEFDGIHTIERALRVGSVDRIISAAELRPYVIDALQRGMARFEGR